LLSYYKNRKDDGDQELFEKLKQDARNKFPDDKRFKRIGY